MEYSADGFENSDGAKYKYKMSFTVEVEVCDYESISRAGFMIGGAIWHWDNPSENKINSCSMITLGDSPTLSVTVTAYARMKDGSDYEGNVETLSATYGNNNNENPGSGSNENTIKTNRAEYTYAWTEYKNFDGVFSSYETMKSHLNRYGLLIYKMETLTTGKISIISNTLFIPIVIIRKWFTIIILIWATSIMGIKHKQLTYI